MEVLDQIIAALEAAQNVRSISFSDEDRVNYVNTLQLITDKPVMYVCNVSEDMRLAATISSIRSKQ